MSPNQKESLHYFRKNFYMESLHKIYFSLNFLRFVVFNSLIIFLLVAKSNIYRPDAILYHLPYTDILNNEKKSGITIHFVNEEYDKGAIIFQKEYALSLSETAESLSEAVQKLEHKHFPSIILQTINDNN